MGDMKEKLTPRNLVKLGSNSLVITVPKSWVRKNNLNKGDIVYTSEQDNNLLIKTMNKPQESDREIIIEYKNKKLDELKAEITTAYIAGYDSIRINKDDKPISNKVKFIIHDLVGLEIVQQKASYIVARELLDLEKTSIKNITRRIDFLVRGMLEDLTNCQKKEDYLNIYERDFDVNRLTFLVFRTINKALINPSILNNLKLSLKELMDSRVFVFNLEQIGDNAKRFARIKYMMKKEDKKITKLLDFFTNLYLEVLEVYYKNDKKRASKIALDNEKRVMMLKEFLHNNQSYINAQIAHIFLNVSRGIRDIARIVLGMD